MNRLVRCALLDCSEYGPAHVCCARAVPCARCVVRARCVGFKFGFRLSAWNQAPEVP